MIENTPHNESLDNYLLGKLSAEEQAAMEAKLAADSQLQEEMLLQRDIVQALQETRRMELKARLNSVEVGAGSFSTAVGIKIAAGVALIGLIGTGIYLYLNQQPAETAALAAEKLELTNYPQTDSYSVPAIPVVVETTAPAIEEEQQQTTAPAPELASAPSVPAAATPALIVKNSAPAKAAEEKKEVSRKEVQIQKPSLLNSFGDAEFIAGTEQAEVPVDAMSRNRQFASKNIEISAQPHDKYNFHYQFYDNRLYIYGEFNQKPYEILEINTEGTTIYYLYFENNYYGLKDNQQKLTKLRRISNDKLIKELEITRTKK